jgi:hypothetical protein
MRYIHPHLPPLLKFTFDIQMHPLSLSTIIIMCSLASSQFGYWPYSIFIVRHSDTVVGSKQPFSCYKKNKGKIN